MGWSSPFLLKITQDKENYNITETEASYFTVVNTIGACILSPFLIPFSNIFGRKPVLLISSIPYILAYLIKAFATNLWLLYFARLCCGFGQAILFASYPIYIAEIATPKVRGVWGNSYVSSALLGYLIINVIGTFCSIQETSYISIALLVVFLVSFSFMPESPYFYIIKGRYEDSKEILRNLGRTKISDTEFDEIKAAVERQISNSASWKDLYKVKANRNAIIAGVFLRVGQQLSGVQVFATYTQFFFKKAGTNISPQIASIIYSAIMALLIIITSYISSKFKRRSAYMLSLATTSIILLTQAIYFYLDQEHPEVNLEQMRWFPLAGMLLFALCTSFGINLIPTLMIGELFSAGIKTKGVSIMTVTFGGGNFVVNIMFYYLNLHSGLAGPFLLFALCNIGSCILSYFIVPETKDKTLEEIQETLDTM